MVIDVSAALAGRLLAEALQVARARCYACSMDATVASRELRNSTRELLARVQAGEEITITVHGRPAAVLAPLRARPRWVAREEFVTRFASRAADARLREDLDALAPDTTDELPW